MPDFNCEVCGDPALGVACSALGPMSFAYCRTCLQEGADVPWMIISCIAGCGGIEHVKQYVIDMIEPSLRRAKISRAEFDAELVKAIKKMDQYYADYAHEPNDMDVKEDYNANT